MKSKVMKEFLSDWFKEGLKEFGISVAQYHKMSSKDRNDVKKSLAEFGHF